MAVIPLALFPRKLLLKHHRSLDMADTGVNS